MCTCTETCGTTGSRELCSLYHDLRLAALRRNTQCTSCAVFFLWHAPCKSSSSLMHSTWCMRATQCMPSTRSRSGSARRCDGDREYVPSSTSSRLQSWARRPISAAARDRGQRPRPKSLPRPRLTVNSSYRCDRDLGCVTSWMVLFQNFAAHGRESRCKEWKDQSDWTSFGSTGATIT